MPALYSAQRPSTKHSQLPTSILSCLKKPFGGPEDATHGSGQKLQAGPRRQGCIQARPPQVSAWSTYWLTVGGRCLARSVCVTTIEMAIKAETPMLTWISICRVSWSKSEVMGWHIVSKVFPSNLVQTPNSSILPVIFKSCHRASPRPM